jgi:predicted nucleic acid-binding protein
VTGVFSKAMALANEQKAKVVVTEDVQLAVMSDDHIKVRRLTQKEYSVTFEKVKNHH